MKYHHLVLLCFAFISIFSTKIASADSKVTIQTKTDADPSVVHFTVGSSIELICNSSENGNITWETGGKLVGDSNDRITAKETNGISTLYVKNSKDSDAGNYTCIVNSPNGKLTDAVVLTTKGSGGILAIKVPKNSNVVEGEKLTIKCQVKGDLVLEWFYLNTTLENANWTKLPGEDERIKIRDYYDEERKVNVTNGELKVVDINMGDRGEYMCQGSTQDGSQVFNMTSSVRVKDKYAALWPFLGICAEVFVLCAIIFIYEKKRNKTELEESDTDQSPDQKNTPDHGKESNLRHRQ